MKRVKNIILSALVIVGIASFSLAPNASAVDIFGPCSGGSQSSVCKGRGDQAAPLIKNIVNILIYLTGAIAVIMIIIGGIKYVTSNGDSSGVTSAKNTILYAVVGLVVAVMAYTIVNFVLTNVATTAPQPASQPERSVSGALDG